MIDPINFSAHINEESINNLAFSSGLFKRNRKLTGTNLVLSVLYSSIEKVASFNKISSLLFNLSGKDVSRQRLQKVISSDNFCSFFNDFIEQIWSHRILPESHYKNPRFGRIILQDSTIIKLPQKLFELYSGVSNSKVRTTNCRIQVCIDLFTSLISKFSINSYSVNDMKSRDFIAPGKNDLVIRDRGYLHVDQLYEFLKKGIHFITRPKSNFTYYDESGEPIDLIKTLKKKKTTIIKVRVNKPEAPLMNLYAQKVSDSIAAKRRITSKLSTKGRTPSKSTLQQLSWSIYLSSFTDESITFEEVWELYSVRWRIEIIFKALKSHLNLDSIHNVSNNQLKILIQAKFAVIILMINFVYRPIKKIAEKIFPNKEISLLKLIDVMVLNIQKLFHIMQILKNRNQAIKSMEIIKLMKLCLYDKRKRRNYDLNITLS